MTIPRSHKGAGTKLATRLLDQTPNRFYIDDHDVYEEEFDFALDTDYTLTARVSLSNQQTAYQMGMVQIVVERKVAILDDTWKLTLTSRLSSRAPAEQRAAVIAWFERNYDAAMAAITRERNRS